MGLGPAALLKKSCERAGIALPLILVVVVHHRMNNRYVGREPLDVRRDLL
jgi:hypothetical protein